MMTKTLLLALSCLSSTGLACPQQPGNTEKQAAIINPYFDQAYWKVWRDDDSPVQGVVSMVQEGKQKKAARIDLSAPPKDKRIYPVDPAKAGTPFVQFNASKTPSQKFAGIWDDVYSSWSGLHGYVRTSWRGKDGSKVAIRDQIIHFVDAQHREMTRCGVNFIHQSTTGMAHAITNGYDLRRTTTFEKLYFADLLVCSPAHASFVDQRAELTVDLYTSHSPTIFNSMGSSNSETMAITKMIIAGGYLPPKTKLLLKRNGLYPAAMLYLWKAALPYDVPYAHELRHRICYKSVGNRQTYPENYSAAGIDRGDLCLPFHQYDDLLHMSRMVTLAASMDVALPEACFEILEVEGGTKRYALVKAATILQEKGQEVKVRVSTKKSYDLQGLPIALRWKLLYGNKDLRVDATDEDGEYLVTVPWDDALPEGRTVLALIANNGRFDSNPALLTIYRKQGDLPGNGLSPKDYRFDTSKGNRRPVLLDLQDQWVRPGRKLEIPLKAYDPEGFVVRFYKRAGEVGEIEEDRFTWKCPRKEPEGIKTVTILASDGTSGNSYQGKQIRIHVGKPGLLPHISASSLVGPAPLEVEFSSKKSIAPRAKTVCYWDVYQPDLKRKIPKLDKQTKSKDHKHKFDKPGLYEVTLTMEHGKQTESETLQILVTRHKRSETPATLTVEGNDVRIANEDATPGLFDHTDFGKIAGGGSISRSFFVVNNGDQDLHLAKKDRITIEGPGAKSFKITDRPASRIAGKSRSRFEIRFKPKGDEPQSAWVVLRAGDQSLRFRIQGIR